MESNHRSSASDVRNYLIFDNNLKQISDDEIDASDQHVLVHLPDGEISIAEKVPPMPRVRLINLLYFDFKYENLSTSFLGIILI